MTSQDVIHDFGDPRLPRQAGRAPRAGTPSSGSRPPSRATYHLFCDQYCGTEHSRHGRRRRRADAAGLPGAGSAGPARTRRRQAGQDAVQGVQLRQLPQPGRPDDGQPVRQPGQGLAGRQADRPEVADDEYIRDSIVDPNHQIVDGYQPLMPSYKGRCSEEQICSWSPTSRRSARPTAARPAADHGGSTSTIVTREPPPAQPTGRTVVPAPTDPRLSPTRSSYHDHRHPLIAPPTSRPARDVPQRPLLGPVVAADQGPQADRHPVHPG